MTMLKGTSAISRTASPLVLMAQRGGRNDGGPEPFAHASQQGGAAAHLERDAQPRPGRGECVLDRAAVGAAVLGQHDTGIGEIAGAKRRAHLSRASACAATGLAASMVSVAILASVFPEIAGASIAPAALSVTLLLVTGAVTALAAAHRVSRVDPLIALRSE